MGTGIQPPTEGETNPYSAGPAALGYLAEVEYLLLLVLRRMDVELEFDVSIETLDDIVFHDGDDAVELLQSKHRVDLDGLAHQLVDRRVEDASQLDCRRPL